MTFAPLAMPTAPGVMSPSPVATCPPPFVSSEVETRMPGAPVSRLTVKDRQFILSLPKGSIQTGWGCAIREGFLSTQGSHA